AGLSLGERLQGRAGRAPLRGRPLRGRLVLGARPLARRRRVGRAGLTCLGLGQEVGDEGLCRRPAPGPLERGVRGRLRCGWLLRRHATSLMAPPARHRCSTPSASLRTRPALTRTWPRAVVTEGVVPL